MDQDFHNLGTYYAAKSSGFNKTEARNPVKNSQCIKQRYIQITHKMILVGSGGTSFD